MDPEDLDEENLPEEPEVELLQDDDPDEQQNLPILKEERSLTPVDPLAAYIHEIQKYEGLTEEEERRLAIEYRKDGDLATAYKLITSNLLLVVKIAMKFKREWQSLMDLIQEGNVGLMQAVKNFDPFRGVRLPAYASWWIRAYILKFLLDNWRLVKVGTTNTRRKLLYNLQKEKEKLERAGIDPSTKRLADKFGVEEGEVIDVQASLGAGDVSMDTPVKDDGSLTPAHFLSDGQHPEQETESSQFRELLREKIAELSVNLKPIERVILETRILTDTPQPLREIGEQYNVTREAVRQAEQRLMKKVKAHLLQTLPEAAEYFRG
ncbi:MAG: RNA polymerase factor sigma-32 [Nitrospinota bacterium]|nr:RNA polymerase factor sigma-32 [Nitrospinota bacterium]